MNRMKYVVGSMIVLSTLFVACKKETQNTSNLKEGIVSHVADAGCGYILWVDSNMYKIKNEEIVYNVCKDRMYTRVLVDYESLAGLPSISCDFYNNKEAQQVQIVAVREK